MKLHSNVHETNKKRKHTAKSELLYSTRFEDNLSPNWLTMKKYRLIYNYETWKSFCDATLKNTITVLNSGGLIQQTMINHLRPKDTPVLRSSDNIAPLFTIDETQTLNYYRSHQQDPREDRKHQYFEYFKIFNKNRRLGG